VPTWTARSATITCCGRCSTWTCQALYPVAEVGFGAVGRSFGFPDVDAATHLWTLDSPAHTWAGLSSPVRIDLRHSGGTVAAHAIGVAEVIAPDDPGMAAQVREVLAALAAKGVTATCTRPEGPRYGALDADSNLPDVRIVLGTANPYGRLVLDETAKWALAVNGRVFLPAAQDFPPAVGRGRRPPRSARPAGSLRRRLRGTGPRTGRRTCRRCRCQMALPGRASQLSTTRPPW